MKIKFFKLQIHDYKIDFSLYYESKFKIFEIINLINY